MVAGRIQGGLDRTRADQETYLLMANSDGGGLIEWPSPLLAVYIAGAERRASGVDREPGCGRPAARHCPT